MSVSALPVKQIHHVEFWVGNAKQAAYFYRKAFGFSQVAYAGPETGVRDRASYVLQQGKIRIVLTTPLYADHPISEHLKKHGDGVRDIAFLVEDADYCAHTAAERGAKLVSAPHDLVNGAGGKMRASAIATYGDTVHSFIAPAGYNGPFLPGYVETVAPGSDCGLTMVDHIVGNVEDLKMNDWAGYYEKVFGFHQFLSFDDKDISTEFSALRSKVMANHNHLVKFPLNEPAAGRKKSQIQEYVEFNNGAGVQHLALLTTDIIKTLDALYANGVDFLGVPDSYYESVWDRVGKIEEDRDAVKKLRILVDRDDKGYLLQLFTKPLEDRPTLFFEIIQRKGAEGFGKGNFKALFESIEREQEKRGNL